MEVGRDAIDAGETPESARLVSRLLSAVLRSNQERQNLGISFLSCFGKEPFFSSDRTSHDAIDLV